LQIQAAGDVALRFGENASLLGNAVFVGHSNQFTIEGSGTLTIGSPTSAPQFFTQNHASFCGKSVGTYHGVFVSRNQNMNPMNVPEGSTLVGMNVSNYHPPNVSGNPFNPHLTNKLGPNALLDNPFTRVMNMIMRAMNNGLEGGGEGCGMGRTSPGCSSCVQIPDGYTNPEDGDPIPLCLLGCCPKPPIPVWQAFDPGEGDEPLVFNVGGFRIR
jgi:hypothetical protein